MRANAVDRIDPTHTTMIRRGYEAELGLRLRKLRGSIIKKLIEQDALGMRYNYAFTQDAAKVDGFMDWLSQEQGSTLEIYKGTSSLSSNTHWSSTYIEKAYAAGVGQSANALRKGGATVAQQWTDEAFRRPIHADRVGILYTRNFSGLQGIVSKIDQAVSRTLASGMVSGTGAREIAKQINSHAEATLNSFEEAGIHGVEVKSEMLTATDACPQCMALARKGLYTISEARGVIPVHPNCRCAWKPVVTNGTGIVLRWFTSMNSYARLIKTNGILNAHSIKQDNE